MITPHQEELLKIANSIQTLGKHETSFHGIIKFIIVQRVQQTLFRLKARIS